MQTLIKKEEFYKTLDLILTPVILSYENQRIFYCNKSFNTQLGYFLQDIHDINDWFEKAYPDACYRKEVAEKWEEKLALAKEKNLPYIDMIARIYCADKTYKWFNVYEYIVDGIRVITFLDIDEIQEKNRALLDVIQQNNNLITVLAHDIRDPLSALQNILLLSESDDFSQDQFKRFITEIDMQINRIFNIIDATMIYKSSELKRFTFNPQHIPMYSFFTRIIAYFERKINQKQLDLRIEIAARSHILFDVFILEIITRNILINAIKYCPPQGIVRIGIAEDPQYWDLVVGDSGPGMTPEQIALLMDNKSPRAAREEIRNGFGLGLLIAKDTLERYGGQLLIDSKPGNGTAFTIRVQKNISPSHFLN